MAVAADLLVDAPLASPELALVDPELAAELRRTHSSVEERWLRPPARVEYFSPESGEDAPPQLEAADDAGHASGDAEQPDNDESIVAVPPEQTSMEELPPSSGYPGRPAHEPEEAAFEDSPPSPLMRFNEASRERDDDASAALCAVAEVVRKAEAVGEQVLDEYIAATPSEVPTRSHYPVLPAPQPDADATDAVDAAFRRIREGMTEADESPSPKRRVRRGFTLASGVVAACAVAALGADVQFHVAHLPSWIQF